MERGKEEMWACGLHRNQTHTSASTRYFMYETEKRKNDETNK